MVFGCPVSAESVVYVWGNCFCMARSLPFRAMLGSGNQTQPPKTLNGELVMSRSRGSGDFILVVAEVPPAATTLRGSRDIEPSSGAQVPALAVVLVAAVGDHNAVLARIALRYALTEF